jgi:hypothetical protein
MLSSLSAKLAGYGMVVLLIGALLVHTRMQSLRIEAMKSQLSGALQANSAYSAQVAEQNKKIGDLMQVELDLQGQVAAAQANLRTHTEQRVNVIKQQKVSNACDDSLKWLRAQSPSLSRWP